MDPIDENKLDFSIITDVSDLNIINPNEGDSLDTLHVREFLSKEANVYRSNNLTSIWKVAFEGQIVALFTVSMNGMEADIIPDKSRVRQMHGRYPAVLLGQMWVKPEFRRKRISYWICQFVIGLARKISPMIACSCVVLQTDESKTPVYQNAKFIRSITSKSGLVWMYRSIT